MQIIICVLIQVLYMLFVCLFVCSFVGLFVFSSDAREYAFQQLQASLAGKDLELAKCQHQLSSLVGETAELRRQHSREGINMDYLKNIMFQFMTFPNNSSEKNSLVPVLAMLLQFTPAEMVEIHEASNRSEVQSWSLFGGAAQSPAAVPMKKPQSHRTAASPSPISPSGAASANKGGSRNSTTPGSKTVTAAVRATHADGGANNRKSAQSAGSSSSSSSRIGHMGTVGDNSKEAQNSNYMNRNGGQEQQVMSTGQNTNTSSNSLASIDSDQELQQKLNQMTSHDILSVSLSYDEADTASENSPVASQKQPLNELQQRQQQQQQQGVHSLEIQDHKSNVISHTV